jgi:N-acetylmuramic acid 6-phosphate (MurNAc-6-P) etherase
MEFITDPFDLPGREFINNKYNTDLNSMHPEERVSFMEQENAKIQSKVNDLTVALQTVIEKMKQKKESKPEQIFIRKNDDFQGKCFDAIR